MAGVCPLTIYRISYFCLYVNRMILPSVHCGLFVEQTDHLFDILSVVKICKHDNRHIIAQMAAGKRLLNRPSFQCIIYINRSLTLRTAKAVGFLLR